MLIVWFSLNEAGILLYRCVLHLSYLTQQWRGDLAVSHRGPRGRRANARVTRRGRWYSKVTEVGIDVMRSRVIKLRLCCVYQDRHQASETAEGEIENKGKLEAHQQGQCAWGVQRAPTARHNNVRL